MNYTINTNVKALVIGDVMLDHYIYGICNRISPEAPVPVVEIRSENYTLGGAGNVLKSLCALSCITDIVSVTGSDAGGKEVQKQLNELIGGHAYLHIDADRVTTIKSRVMVANHQLIRLDQEQTSAINTETANKLIQTIAQVISNFDIVLISDYNKGVLSAYFLQQLFTLCKERGLITVVDPKGTDYSKYLGANFIKPNKKEAAIAAGLTINNNDDLKRACIKIAEVTKCDGLVVTLSEDGMATFSDGQLHIIPTKALSVIDVTGAGDTVLASLSIALASGATLAQACDFANHAAAVVVSKVGSATATLAEIQEKYSN